MYDITIYKGNIVINEFTLTKDEFYNLTEVFKRINQIVISDIKKKGEGKT